MVGLLLWKKRAVLRLGLKESSEGFFQRGSGRSFDVEGLKTEKVWQPTVENLVREIWNGEYQKLSRHYWRMCKVEDRHRDKTEEQCARHIYSRDVCMLR